MRVALAAFAFMAAIAPNASAQFAPYTLTPSSLTFTFPGGRAVIHTQELVLKNNSTVTLPFQGGFVPANATAYLSFSPATGSLGPGQTTTLTVSVNEQPFSPEPFEYLPVNLYISTGQGEEQPASAQIFIKTTGGSASPTPTPAATPPSGLGLDQKLAARDSRIRLNIRGSGFGADAVPQFLHEEDNTVDTELVISNVQVVSANEIQAELFVTSAALGDPKILRVVSAGGSAVLHDPISIVDLRLDLSQGAKTPATQERVANHATVVRAGVQHPIFGPVLPGGISGLLYVFKANTQISDSPFAPTKPLNTEFNKEVLETKSIYTEDDLYFLRDTLNFYFGLGTLPSFDALDEGDYTFILAVSPTDPSHPPPRQPDLSREQVKANRDFIVSDKLPPQRFVTSKPLRLFLIVDPRLSDEAANELFNLHSRSIEYLAAAYPIDNSRSKLDVRRAAVLADALDLDSLKPAAGQGFWGPRVLDRLAELLRSVNQLRPSDQQFDKVTLLLDSKDLRVITADLPSPDIEGYATIDGTSSFFGGRNFQALSHELGHNFGLYDTYKKFPPPRRPPNPRGPYAPDGGNIIEPGTERLAPIWGNFLCRAASASVDADGTVLPQIDYRSLSLMGAATFTNWPDVAEWKYLYNKFRLSGGRLGKSAGQSVGPKSASATLLSVQGFVSATGSVNVTQIGPEAFSSAPVEPGDYTLELLGPSGQVLSSASFGVNFEQPDAGLTTQAPFRVSMAFPGGSIEVRIRKGASILFSRMVSANAPNVQVLAPQGGETLGGPFTITWTAGDPDGDPLTYSVLYLRADGLPIPIARGLTATNFQWNDPALNGGGAGGRIVVVASDGVNEGTGMSGEFTVGKGGPAVTILEPQNGVSIPAGTQAVLSGAGSDPEDGYLPSASLSFRSNIDGEFGPGGNLTRGFSEGLHTITLRGTDSDGNVAERSITLRVGPASSVPFINSISPASAPANSTVTLAGNNLGSGNIVRFGSSIAPIVGASSTQLIVQVPAGLQLGETQVSVTSGAFTSPALFFTITNGRPLLSSLTPNTGAPGTPVSIGGAEFAEAATGNVVRFGGVQATVLGGNSNNLVVAVPEGVSAGAANVTVNTSQGTSDPLPFVVTSGNPATPVLINSLLPPSGTAGAVVTINGSGFSTVLNRNLISFGEFSVAPVSATNESLQVAVPFGLASGSVNLVVTVDGYPSNPLPFTVSSGTNPTPTPGQPGCTPAPANLVSFWRAEGNANDSAGGNNGTLTTGPTFVPGKVGQAFNLDGADDIVSFGNPGNLQLTTALTAEAWIRPDTTLANFRTVVSKWSQGSQSSWGLFVTNNVVYGIVGNASGQFTDAAGGSVPFGANAPFTHVAMTYSPAEGIKVYFNGALVNSDVGIGNIRNGSDVMRIGNDTDLISDRYFDGLIDEVSIYSRVLSAAEIQGIYNAGAAGKCSDANASPTPAPVSAVQNISTRVVVGTGENVAIGGFIVQGSGSKGVIVRAIGPSLANFGVAGSLEDPTLELFNGSGNVIAFNDDWLSSGQNQEIAALLPPGDGVEAAIIASLTPGNYTAVLRGYNDATGIALVEVYDLDQAAPSRLANISTRGQAGTGGSVLIGGFIVGKQAQFVVRAIGPSLGAAGIGNALGNPVLELYNAQGDKLDTNDNWQDNPLSGQVSGLGLAPNNALESALIHTLPAGNYTAIVRGVNDGVGVGLVEIYSLQ